MLEYKKVYTLPFKFEIPNYTKEFLEKSSNTKSWIKYLKRYLYLFFKGQHSLEVFQISEEHAHILWINFSAPSLGDSLMDLSSRVMLSDRKIDLFTHRNNVQIFKNDSFFSSVFSDASQLSQKTYDLVIIDSYSTRSVNIKAQIALLVPFVGMFGYYNGPEVNRVLFSFHRMNNLIGYKKSKTEIERIAKPSIFISKHDKELIKSYNLPENFIAIVVGGEWSFRTFNKWELVIEKLIKQDSKVKIILIGSDNGKDAANLIINMFSNNVIIDYVSKFTFNQTAEIINQAKFIICCDGGLMHAANSLGITNVALLAKLNADMQLTEVNKCFSLYDDSNVNNISIDNIFYKCREASNSVHSHL